MATRSMNDRLLKASADFAGRYRDRIVVLCTLEPKHLVTLYATSRTPEKSRQNRVQPKLLFEPYKLKSRRYDPPR